jgi:RNA polymerase sigma-70 factor (ECF subfamily)
MPGETLDVDHDAEMEASLIERSLNGDRDAFGELVHWYYHGVINVVYRLCGEAGLAEDMAQEAFLRAWTRLSSFHKGASLRNWFYRIAINATLDVLRRKNGQTMDDEQMQMLPDQSPGPEQALIHKEQVALLEEALQSLPEASRSVLVLREYGGLSYHEIASVLDIPIGTVMSRLNYARERLRELVKAQVLKMEVDHA